MTIGLIPCAGTATRIHGLPKYLLPVSDGYLIGLLIESMMRVSAQPIIGVSPENASIVDRYKKSAFVYTAKNYKTMTETVLSGRRFCDADNVVFGMPDTFVEDDKCFAKLTAALADGADVAVALFHARPRQHLKAGMCSTLGNQVQEVVDKPVNQMHFTLLWGALAWKPVFWDHMRAEDPHVGYALPRAVRAGLDVRAVKMDGQYFDCGTFNEYAELITHIHGRKEASEMQQVYG